MPYLDVDDLHTYYQEDWFGPPWEEPEVMLLQNGYAANSNHFGSWIPGLADQYRVLRRDSVGHGRTSAGATDRDLSLSTLADDVIAFLDAMGLESVHYVGERTGAMTGVVLGARYPDRIRSVSLFGCPIACGQGLQLAMWEMLAPELKIRYSGWNDAMRGLGGAFAWHDHVKWLDAPGNHAYNDWQRTQLHLCDEALLERYALATIDYDVSEFLAKVATPTLILAPTATYRTNFDQQIELRTTIPGAELEIVEGSVGRADDGSAPRLTRRIREFIDGRAAVNTA